MGVPLKWAGEMSDDRSAFALSRAAKIVRGLGWIHEIKHDGFRIMARRADGRVRLLTRKAYNFANRVPQIAAALTVLPVRSCMIDGGRRLRRKRPCRFRPDPQIPSRRRRGTLRPRPARTRRPRPCPR
jgi:hypothetical protein